VPASATLPLPPPLGDAWLERLRRDLDEPRITLAAEPEGLAKGGDALVYGVELEGAPPALCGPLVLRVFTRQLPAAREAFLQNAVADQGFPAPRVPWACDDDGVHGGPLMLVARVAGRTLLGAPPTRARHVWQDLDRGLRIGTILAEVALALHALDADAIVDAGRLHGFDDDALSFRAKLDETAERVAACSDPRLDEAQAWLESTRPEQPARRSVCHGDLNPSNLIYDDGGLRGVIDWSACSIGEPEEELGILRTGMLTMPLAGRVGAMLLRRMTRRMTGRYESERPLDPVRLGYYEAWISLVLVVRCREATRGERSDGGPWDEPAVQRALSRHFEVIAGIPLLASS
jgi:aminoglycoside phosphotransferase (APT) family kinase protein